MTTPTMRPYAPDRDDYWRLRAFLRETYRLNARRERSWQVYRFDYCHWHIYANCEDDQTVDDAMLLWETDSEELAAALTSEGWGDVWMQVHPAWRTPALEAEMIAAAEARLAAPEGDSQKLTLWAHADDTLRRDLLQSRGYTRGDWPEYQRYQSLEREIPDVPLAEGYAVRALGDADELPARSRLSWMAFHSDDPDGYDGDWSWYRNVQRAPLYRRDLDLVAVAPDGALVSFCTVWFDDVNRSAALEPVGTHPDHRQRGLGKAVLTEALRRAQRLGATRAHVGSYDTAAHALYASVGFQDYVLAERWEKTWTNETERPA